MWSESIGADFLHSSSPFQIEHWLSILRCWTTNSCMQLLQTHHSTTDYNFFVHVQNNKMREICQERTPLMQQFNFASDIDLGWTKLLLGCSTTYQTQKRARHACIPQVLQASPAGSIIRLLCLDIVWSQGRHQQHEWNMVWRSHGPFESRRSVSIINRLVPWPSLIIN